ncbi:sterol desaturase family protein [Paraburkholderia sp. DHOC27]|uniref:sterol desaturase family protein n=1 Tax=Paraburkholderia sp. DHOC27 TaxID=2303330 RepID=UPI000E3E00EA|nr:sterol desaturase family protein [Paraburkholderia sp. DHOC27]RFU44176.1 sterol desaturase family protein [Paraburkholderia sp. DHOC27]
MDIKAALLGTLPLLAIILVALLIERTNPAEVQPLRSAGFNLVYTVVFAVVQTAVVPLVSVVTVVAVNAAGGGWIKLPGTGWGLLFGALLYTFTLDLMEYLFHRAQHRFPVMWAMHSFHHSDTALNATTTNRHHWAEHGIKMLTIYLLVGVIFKINPAIVGVYAVISLYNVFPHMNLRIGFGRLSFALNSPQYHRVHHSVLPEHYDCNFAALFPVFDVMFGTYREPREGEFPPTGLDNHKRPSGLIDAMIWPVRVR